MKKVVKLTESDLEKLVQRILEEEGGNQPDFLFKTEYNPNDKSITASYYLLGENDRTWDLLNIQEKERMSAVWGDDAKVYTYQPVVFKLPKSQAMMVEEIGNTGYFIFKIPYWLYKKNVEGLGIKRSLVKKRLSIARSQVYGDYLKLINDPNVEKYFFEVDKDESSRQRFKSYQRHYKG